MNVPATLVFTAWCLVLGSLDVRSRRLPNAVTLPGAVAAVAYGFAVGKPTFALLGASMLALPYLIVHLLCPPALGAGDVKLTLGLGAVTALAGPQTWAWAALAAPMLTAAAGVGTLALGSFPRAAAAPFLSPRPATSRAGPGGGFAGSACGIETLAHGASMCAASVVAVVAGR